MFQEMKINKFLVLSLALVLIVGVVESFDYHDKEVESEEGLQAMYDRWRSHHKVEHKSEERFNVFKSNVEHVHNTNKLNRPYKLELNKFADLTNRERISKYSDSKTTHLSALKGPMDFYKFGDFLYQNVSVEDLPPVVDWRDHNAVTPIKNQGQCGSCWAFAAVAAVEGINAIRTGHLVELSEQQIVDCDNKGVSEGCDGGLFEEAFQWIHDHGGLTSSENYPYVMKVQDCDTSKFGHHVATLDGGQRIPYDDEIAMQKAVAHHPISMTLDPYSPDFGFYKEGVFNAPCGVAAAHAMAVVGYGETPEGMKYWLVKNSWGEDWGDKGYIKFARGVDQPHGICAIGRWGFMPVKSIETRNIEL